MCASGRAEEGETRVPARSSPRRGSSCTGPRRAFLLRPHDGTHVVLIYMWGRARVAGEELGSHAAPALTTSCRAHRCTHQSRPRPHAHVRYAAPPPAPLPQMLLPCPGGALRPSWVVERGCGAPSERGSHSLPVPTSLRSSALLTNTRTVCSTSCHRGVHSTPRRVASLPLTRPVVMGSARDIHIVAPSPSRPPRAARRAWRRKTSSRLAGGGARLLRLRGSLHHQGPKLPTDPAQCPETATNCAAWRARARQSERSTGRPGVGRRFPF